MEFKIMEYKLSSALFVLIVLVSSCGQNGKNDPKIESTPTKDSTGLQVPNSMVRNVKKDKKGNILVASFKGVFRYNGKSFTNLTAGIKSPSFWDVLEDGHGNLWFGSRDSGVYRYNGKQMEHFTRRDGLAGNSALHLYEDRTGNIWFGATRYDGKTFTTLSAKDGLPDNNINSVVEDKAGNIWFAAWSSTFFYDGKSFTTPMHDGKPFKNVRSIIEDRKGNIWLGGSDGLWRYNGKIFTNITKKFTGHVYEDSKGNIWTSAEIKNYPMAWTLFRYDEKTLYDKEPVVTEIKKSEGQAFCGIVEADDGSIWFGSLGPNSGVFRYDGKTFTDFKTQPATPR